MIRTRSSPRHVGSTRYPALCLAVLFAACSGRAPSSVDEYMRWLNDPGHGLVQTKTVGGFRLTLAYLPADYMAYQELRNEPATTGRAIDSVRRVYDGALTFALTIAPDEEHGARGDVMAASIGSYDQFVERTMQMSFQMRDYVELEIDGHRYRPDLSTMESTNGLTKERRILLVFARPAGSDRGDHAPTIDVVFGDTIFDTGIHHFMFDRRRVDEVPTLDLSNVLRSHS